ncbi:MAG: carbon storage regulator CsrA [Desulfitobacteriaceae bacterium]|nr:carbon storage regulator CsrA [Desulfitobacteriaceae bacterium]MDI6879464.1 carbon storage regulator CsrA [Desulfitobacteriaceae bacterium]MDI6912943.1 carbon storage regulator CsrA [Desulfitobacteriaceae bacterium]
MLVLSRKLDQRIKIGEDIEIVVVSISGDTVKLGIEAPRSVKVLRSEVYEEIRDQNRQAVIEGGISESLQAILGITKPSKD